MATEPEIVEQQPTTYDVAFQNAVILADRFRHCGESYLNLAHSLVEGYYIDVDSHCKDWKKRHWCREKKTNAVHISGVIPFHLIHKRRPLEPEDIADYRFLNYKPLTKGLFRQAIDALNTIFNPQGYVIKTEKDLTEYLELAKFDGFNFYSWWQQKYLTFMLEDPNGLVVCLPGGDLEKAFVENQSVTPYLQLIGSENILEIESEDGTLEYIFYLKEYDKHEGYCEFVYLDQNFYLELRQSTKSDSVPEIVRQQAHSQGEVPAKVAGGHFNAKNDCFESFFSAAIPAADQFVCEQSDHDGTMIRCANPHMIVSEIACTEKGCQNGYIVYPTDVMTEAGTPIIDSRICGGCGGTGKMPIPSSPYGTITRPKQNTAISGTPDSSMPLAYVSAPTEPLRFQSEELDKHEIKIKQALHLEYTERRGIESAASKELGRENANAQFLLISDNVFGMIEFALNRFAAYRNYTHPEPVIVVAPTAFSMKTESIIIEEIKSARESGVSNMVVVKLETELINKKYAGDEQSLREDEFLRYYNAYKGYTLEQLQELKAMNVMSDLEFARATKGSGLITRFLFDNKGFEIIPENYVKLAEGVDKMIQALLDANKPPEPKQPFGINIPPPEAPIPPTNE